MSPHSLAELEKEVGNLRKGLRAVEVVSTSSCLPGFEGMLSSGTLGQMVAPRQQTLSSALLAQSSWLGDRLTGTASSTDPDLGEDVWIIWGLN